MEFDLDLEAIALVKLDNHSILPELNIEVIVGFEPKILVE